MVSPSFSLPASFDPKDTSTYLLPKSHSDLMAAVESFLTMSDSHLCTLNQASDIGEFSLQPILRVKEELRATDQEDCARQNEQRAHNENPYPKCSGHMLPLHVARQELNDEWIPVLFKFFKSSLSHDVAFIQQNESV